MINEAVIAVRRLVYPPARQRAFLVPTFNLPVTAVRLTFG
jgi:hypothetical protein